MSESIRSVHTAYRSALAAKDAEIERVAKHLKERNREYDDLVTQIAALREALAPFAAVGRLLDGPFGPVPRVDDNASCGLGCAWTEDGVKKTLAWSAFRRAALEMSGGVK